MFFIKRFINDKEFLKTKEYRDFMMINSGKGNLKIRAYAASEALPVSGLKIIVSTNFLDDEIIFFDGETDSSGMVKTLSLPAPPLEVSNLEAPIPIIYHIYAGSLVLPKEFSVNMYDGVCVVQNINFVLGEENGS